MIARALRLVVFVAIIYGPLLALLPHLADACEVSAMSARHFVLLGRSVGLAAGTTLFAMLIGLPAALLMWQWRDGPLARLRWLPLALALMPPYVHALVWTQAGAGLNVQLAALGLPELPLHGWVASCLVQALALLPLATGLSLLGLGMVQARLIEAGRTLKPDAQVLSAIVLPLAAPAIVAGAGLVFLLGLMDYSVPSLLSVNVYALDVFAEYSASGNPAGPLLMALPLLALAAVVVLASQSALRHAASVPELRQREGGGPPRYPAWLTTLQWLALTVLALNVLVMFAGLAAATGSVGDLLVAAANAKREIGFTFATALVAAVVCLPLALTAAHGMAARGARGWAWRLLVTAPLVIPAPLIGIGLVELSVRSGGGLLMPALAGVARFTPFAAIIMLAQLRRLDPLLLDASRVLHTRSARTWLQVRLTLLAPGLLASATVVFALTAGELGATLVVAPPGWATVTMRIYNYLHYGGSAEVAGLCLLMAAGAVGAGGLAALALGRWSRFLTDGQGT